MNGGRDLLFGNAPIEWIQDVVGLGRPFAFEVFSLLGDTWGILAVVGLAFWWFGRRTMYALVTIVVVGAATKLVLSDLFNVPRPHGEEIVVYDRLEVGSFPSGHVYEAVGPWGLLYVLGCVPLWVPALIAALVGVGRLYLGAHYLGDVLGGVLFGVVLVWAFAKVWPHLRGWLSRRGWGFYLLLAGAVIAGTFAWLQLAGGNARRYEVFGMLLAAAVGLPLEHRFLRYAPAGDSPGARALRAVIGLAGIVALLVFDRSRPGSALLLGMLTAGCATLWAVLGAPALFLALGMGARQAPEPRRRPGADTDPERARTS